MKAASSSKRFRSTTQNGVYFCSYYSFLALMLLQDFIFFGEWATSSAGLEFRWVLRISGMFWARLGVTWVVGGDL